MLVTRNKLSTFRTFRKKNLNIHKTFNNNTYYDNHFLFFYLTLHHANLVNLIIFVTFYFWI